MDLETDMTVTNETYEWIQNFCQLFSVQRKIYLERPLLSEVRGTVE